ncbi:hypothetical protein B8W90_13665, partial [Staphylococcus hominis]
ASLGMARVAFQHLVEMAGDVGRAIVGGNHVAVIEDELLTLDDLLEPTRLPQSQVAKVFGQAHDIVRRLPEIILQ